MLLTEMFQYLAAEIVDQVPKQEYILSGSEENLQEEVKFKAGQHTIEAIFNELYSKEQLEEMTKHLEQSYELFKATAPKDADESQLKKGFFDVVAKPIAGSIEKVTRAVVNKEMETMSFFPSDYKHRYGKTDWQRRKYMVIGLIVVIVLMILAGVIVELVRLVQGKAQLSENILVFVVAAFLLLLVALFGKRQASVFAACARKEILNLMSEEVLNRFAEMKPQALMSGQENPLKALIMEEETGKIVSQLDLAINVKGIQSAFRMAPADIGDDVLMVLFSYLYEEEVSRTIQLMLWPKEQPTKPAPAPEQRERDDKEEEEEKRESEPLIQFNTTTKRQKRPDTGAANEEITLEMEYTGKDG